MKKALSIIAGIILGGFVLVVMIYALFDKSLDAKIFFVLILAQLVAGAIYGIRNYKE